MIGGELLAGAGVVLAYVVGYGVGRAGRRHRAAAGRKQPRAECPCGHAIGFHEDRDGRCHAEDETRLHTGPASFRDVMVACECRHYSGPQLIDTFTLREVTQRPTTTDAGE